MRNAFVGLAFALFAGACTESNMTSLPDEGTVEPTDAGAADCGADAKCGPGPVGCTSDVDCQVATPRCDKNSGKCVECLPLNDNCPKGERCVANNDTYKCSVSCVTAMDCPKPDGGAPSECCSTACVDTTADNKNCGGCGKVCPTYPNAPAVCASGVCALGTCDPGFANCDNIAVNGCEADTMGDGKNCGMCGRACPAVKNGTGGCMAGMCTIVCNAGFLHCSQNPADGCEVSKDTNISNCGACGNVCGQLANAATACMGGSCTVASCNFGFGDCDKMVGNGCEAALQTDVNNCGACGKACGAVTNGNAACKNGVCVIDSCNQGFANCDGLFATGCVTPTATDPKNCGGCGKTCGGPNSMQACQAGACVVTSCSNGFSHCSMKASDGCEVNISSDAMNCGGCGKACMAAANGNVACKNAACVITSCKFGFDDCNKDPMDGCEASLLMPANCGMCGNVCPAPPHASPGCGGGVCGIGMCQALFGDCNGNANDGCERDVSNDTMNCGGCKKVCVTPNGNPACIQGQCGVLNCFQGFTDCDMVAANGCESVTSTDVMNCGGCGNVCPVPANATPSCANSKCGAACMGGFGDCNMNLNDGCEVSLQTDTSNCGSCGMVCGAVANGTPGCAAAKCGIDTCNGGFADCDKNAGNGCERNVTNDINNCGACGKACAFPNANPGCLNSQCGILSCAQGFADCDGNVGNGCEVDLTKDNKNCGMCGTACGGNTPNCASSMCTACVTKVYDLTNRSDTDNLPSECSGTGLYPYVSAGAGYGAHWTDTAGGGTATVVKVELVTGINCNNGNPTHVTQLNGANNTNLALGGGNCNCSPTFSGVETVTYNNPAGYKVGQVNNFKILNNAIEEGVAKGQGIGNDYFRVTVTTCN